VLNLAYYRGEAQLLTSGTEANLLMLKALRSKLDEQDTQRWEEIKKDFLRNKAMGGDASDSGQRIVAQLVDLVDGVGVLGENMKPNGELEAQLKHQTETAQAQMQHQTASAEAQMKHQAETINAQMKQQAESAKVLRASLAAIGESVDQQKRSHISITNTPSAEFAQVLQTLSKTIDTTLFPLVRSMDNRIAQDVKAHSELKQLAEEVQKLKRKKGFL